jgi:cytochrome b pre-mRNA-processing protein 3
MILRLFGKDPRREAIAALYGRVAAASRAPGLYLQFGVPDTVEGRFESLSLHVMLVLRALRVLPPPADEVARDLADALFRDLDAALREMGVGDTSVPKRMKTLAEAFYGRARAYDAPLDAGDAKDLSESLGRNVLGREGPADPLARYALEADRRLRMQDLDGLLRDGPQFPDPDAVAREDTP